MKISKLELRALEIARDTKSDALLKAHQDAYTLVCDNQDDACTVTEEIALQLLDLVHQHALVTTVTGVNAFDGSTFVIEYVGISLRAHKGDMVLWLSVFPTPEISGRYYVTTASDTMSYFE